MSDTEQENLSDDPYAAPVQKDEKTQFEGVFHPDFEKLYDAIERLYIKNNQSGRLRFMEEWPDAARYILGIELNAFDSVGVPNPKQKARFEDQAQLRRDTVILALEDVHERIVQGGVLQLETIGEIMEKLGPEMTPLVFAPQTLAKVDPNYTPPAPEAPETPDEPAEEGPQAVQEDITEDVQQEDVQPEDIREETPAESLQDDQEQEIREETVLPEQPEPIPQPEPEFEPELEPEPERESERDSGPELAVPATVPPVSQPPPEEESCDADRILYQYDLSVVNRKLLVNAKAYALSNLAKTTKPGLSQSSNQSTSGQASDGKAPPPSTPEE